MNVRIQHWAIILVTILLGIRSVPAKRTPSHHINELQALSEQVTADSQYDLGLLYALGEKVPQDYQKAAIWFRKAAEQGHARAQSNLGYMYLRGEGVPQDYPQAVTWFRRAAEQGNVHAQFNLGDIYRKGEGVP
ncbi:MAG: tetratricopeptide repeat protein, partial [Desulfofustis sp.]